MSDKALAAAKNTNFAIEDMLQANSRVIYEKAFSTRHVGRILDFLVYESMEFVDGAPEAGVAEYRIRNILELSIFNGWTNYRKGEEAKCIEIEMGWDNEKLILAVAHYGDSDLSGFVPGSETPNNETSTRMRTMLERIKDLADGMIVRRDPVSGRVQVITIIDKAKDNPDAKADYVEIEAMNTSQKPRGGATYPDTLASSEVKAFLEDEKEEAGQSTPEDEAKRVKGKRGEADGKSKVEGRDDGEEEGKIKVKDDWLDKNAHKAHVKGKADDLGKDNMTAEGQREKLSQDELMKVKSLGDGDEGGALDALLSGKEPSEEDKDKQKGLLRVKGGGREEIKEELLKVKGKKEVLKDEVMKVQRRQKLEQELDDIRNQTDDELDDLLSASQKDLAASDEDLLKVKDPSKLAEVDKANQKMKIVNDDGTVTEVDIDDIDDKDLDAKIAEVEKGEEGAAQDSMAPIMEATEGMDENLKQLLQEIRNQMKELFPTVPKDQLQIGINGISGTINENFMRMVHHVSRMQGIQAVGKVGHYKEKIEVLQTKLEAMALERDKALDKAGLKSIELSEAKMSLEEREQKDKGYEIKFQDKVENFKKDIQEKKIPEKAAKWAEGFMEEILKDRSELNQRSREVEIHLRQKEHEFKSKITTLKEMVRKNEEMVKQKDFMLGKAKESLTNMTDTLERTRQMASQKMDQAEVQHKLLSMEKLLKVAKKSNEQMANRVAEVQAKWSEEFAHRAAIQKNEGEKEKRIAELTRRLEEKSNATVQRLELELEQKDRQIDNQRRKISEAEKNPVMQLELLRKDKEIENLKRKQDQIMELSEKKFTAELAQKDKLIENIKKKIAQGGTGAASEFIQKDLEQKNRQIEELKKKLEQSGNISHFNTQLQQKEREIGLLKKQIDSGGPYKKELEKKEKEIEGLKKRLEKGGGEVVQALRNEVRQKELLIENLEKKVEKAGSTVAEALRKELRGKDNEIQALKTNAEKGEGAKVKALVNDLNKKEQQIKDLKKQLDDGDGAAARALKAEIKQKDREIQDQQRKVKEAERLKGDARAQVQKQQDAAKKVVDGLKKQVSDLQQKLMKTATEMKALSVQAGKNKAQGAGSGDSGLKHKLDQANKLFQASKTELDRTKKRLDETKQAETKLRVEVAKLQAQLKAAAKKAG